MKLMRTVAAASLAVAASCAALTSASAASLLGQTLTGLIQISGDDDNGAYTFDVLNGAVDVGAGYSQTFNVFRQHTFGGQQLPSGQLAGTIGLDIAGDTVAVNFTGQAQGVRIVSSFSGIAGTILALSHTSDGFVDGLSVDQGVTFTSSSATFRTYLLGYQPGTDVTQTATLTFAPDQANGVPEPGARRLGAPDHRFRLCRPGLAPAPGLPARTGQASRAGHAVAPPIA